MTKAKSVSAISFKRFKNNEFVFGKTTIDHKIRVNLNLSCDEYVFMEYMKYWQDNKVERITQGLLWRYTGIKPLEAEIIINSLKEKKLLYRDEKTKVVTTSQDWDDQFNAANDFKKFWEIAQKGNRERARKYYLKCIKIISHEELSACYKKYVENCDLTGTFRQHTSTWLNPKNKEWENVLDQINMNNKENEVKPNVLDEEF